MGGQGTAPTNLAGKVRPVKPKNITGASQISTTEWDYTDGTTQSNMDRGQDPVYGMPRDAINADLRSLNDSPFTRLVGDSFCSATESQINLLSESGFAATVGTGPLTNNNSVTQALDTSDDESPIWNNTVAVFASASSQYLSVPTAAAVQVGTNSYMATIAFKTITTSTLEYLFSYGSHVSGKGYWEIYFNASGQLVFGAYDGTNTDTITDTLANVYQDGRWHFATIIADRTLLKYYLIIDGRLVNAGGTTVTATGSITVSGENFYIGAYKNSSGNIASYFNGSLAFFKLINNAADYNVPQVWERGITQAVSSGTFTAPTTNTNCRLNNTFGTPNANNAYFYTIVYTEDGEYEIQIAYLTGSANGQLDLIIDGNTVSLQLNTYSSSASYNNILKIYAIKMTAGPHTIKIYNDGKSSSSTGYAVNLQWINFIKRRGHEMGGMTRSLMFGDEISERSNAALTTLTDNNSAYYNNEMQNAWTANSSYTEGSLYLKGGYYRIDYIYSKGSSAGKADLWFGNQEIFSTLDHYAGSASYGNVETVYARLQQGRQDIRLVADGKNASSADYYIYMESLRIERLSD